MNTNSRGIYEPARFLDLVRNLIVFRDDGKAIVKKVAQNHQLHAVQGAVHNALEAAGTNGDGKGGVL